MKIFIGWDSREDIAYQVCRASLLKHTSVDLDIVPIKQKHMREKNLYWREHDPLSSTEFTFTRFLVPYLNGYKGWAVFMDCDFLWRGDVATILNHCDYSSAVMVVKHNYNPPERTKMDGAVQTQYPRKNWSSLMLVNCEHEQVQKNLTLNTVNTATGLYLHRIQWATSDCIGELPVSYNYLEGWHTKDDCPNPLAVHFTRGGPWFRDYMNVEYGDEWIKMSRGLVHE
jgi:hypothetical protein